MLTIIPNIPRSKAELLRKKREEEILVKNLSSLSYITIYHEKRVINEILIMIFINRATNLRRE